MNLILQPPGSSLCGQACVAMIFGIDLDLCIDLYFSRRGSTRTKDLVRALRMRGVEVLSDKLKRVTEHTPWPHRAIIKEIFGPKGKRKGHWVLLWDGKIYDPDPHGVRGRYSSYLEIL